jgi:hypothetical protein
VFLSLLACVLQVYSLVDNSYMNEMEDGVTWSFYYFFCNKELRRICYFSCHAVSKYRIRESFENSEAEDGEGDDDAGVRKTSGGEESDDDEMEWM